MSSELFFLTRQSPTLSRVNPSQPGSKTFGVEMATSLNEIRAVAENSEQLKVVLFDSVFNSFFVVYYDFLAKTGETNSSPGPTGLHPLPDMLVRLSGALVASVVKLRGASNPIRGSFEVGAGLVTGAHHAGRIPAAIGCSCAPESLLETDDIPGDLAEQNGYFNRSFADPELESFTDSLAGRIGAFDKQAFKENKFFMGLPGSSTEFDCATDMTACYVSVGRPSQQQIIKMLLRQVNYGW
jgi:hypothetical protein